MSWHSPSTLEEALNLLEEEQAQIVCGGTDLFVNFQAEQELRNRSWLNIQHLPELRQIRRVEGGIEIGAAVTASEIWQSTLLEELPALQEASRVIGGWQIQNRASIGGNLANASPAADLIIPLVAYEATVTLKSKERTRIVPLVDFVTAPKKTTLEKNEMITAIFIPDKVSGLPQTFLRHDQRGGTDISLVSVAVVLEESSRRVNWLNVAVGAANGKPVFAAFHDVESNETAIARLAELVAAQCQPITDVRASAAYRQAMVSVFIKKALTKLALT
ncbi:FAD binding domain-containing protein [Alkalihalobacillus oceani]|uniref:FAD binding domain-containing protein n=1 Tax=Halalkalibacter oceani TaxID=1653776 RepID=A0A9X2DLX1_9BACI|nr:FAD binding domain-containing protein [Halalkalibacter oceani]MCM3712540.1 FAD binding domain-containing protein [Halalkalibacter oceani]